MNLLNLIGRDEELFTTDLNNLSNDLNDIISKSSFLILGASGTIGQAVSKEIFIRNPSLLHLVDLSENNMVELVRDFRSSIGYSSGEFKTFALDCGSIEFDALMSRGIKYDYIFNLSALKHVRSEKDPYTLMRMTVTNIINTIKILEIAKAKGSKNYFCVSSDKAANPVNLMGASKRIMELFLMRQSFSQSISMARFANVAFSDGSLLHGFSQRFQKQQPFSSPNDTLRYFITSKEAGILCLLSGIFGYNRDIFFPKLSDKLELISFPIIAKRYLKEHGYDVYDCKSEDEARSKVHKLIPNKKWPCYFFKSDTTGEKDFEEFFTKDELLDLERFETIGVIKSKIEFDEKKLDEFLIGIEKLRNKAKWSKEDILELFYKVLPDFKHKDTGKFLDDKM